MPYSTYDDRKAVFRRHEGENVIITVSRTDHFRQGSHTDKINYVTRHVGKVKNGVFYEKGKRSPFSFMVCELQSVSTISRGRRKR